MHSDHLDRQLSKLPRFHTVKAKDDGRARYCHASTNIHVPRTERSLLLKRFAKFLMLVAQSDQISFVATDRCVSTLVTATRSASGQIEVEQSDIYAKDGLLAEFAMVIGGPACCLDGSEHTLLLQIQKPTSKHNEASVTLCLHAEHGNSTAASNLLDLALSELKPESKAGPPKERLPPGLEISQSLLEVPRPRLMQADFERNARLFPDALAIDFLFADPFGLYQRVDLTYAELAGKVNRLSKELVMMMEVLDWKPVRDDQRIVPLMLPVGIELLIGMLAVLKTGHAFCPLPMDAPEERILSLLEDMQSPVILGIGVTPWTRPAANSFVWVDLLNSDQWRESLVIPDSILSERRAPTENDVAYVLFTSGSTGKPKGVLVSHNNLVHAIDSISDRASHLPKGPRLRWFVMSSPTFDAFMLEVFVTQRLGGTLCIAERNTMLTDTESVINELRAIATFAVSSLAMLLQPERMPTLKTLVVGGEMLSERVVSKFAAASDLETAVDRCLINVYGPTECTICISAELVAPKTRCSVVGATLQTASVYVCDAESGRELAHGLAGELYIGGPQVTLGYLNLPAETAKSFVQDPCRGRLFRTGDKVRIVWDDDGTPKIEFLGRLATDQVKLNGRRTELPEIEAVLTRIERVAEVAVVVQNSATLIACVVLRKLSSDVEGVEAECRVAAERMLPAWMRPKSYTLLDRLPRTSSGKIDRKELKLIIDNDVVRNGRYGRVDPTLGDISPTVDINVRTPSPAKATNISGIAVESLRAESRISVQNGPVSKSKESSDVPTGIPFGRLAVCQALATVLGEHVTNVEGAVSLINLGLDSLRGIAFLQAMRGCGIKTLTIRDVLSADTLDNLVCVVERVCSQDRGLTVVHVDEDPSIDDMDVTKIAVDDDEAVDEFTIQEKLAHFDHHCRPQCIKSLQLDEGDIDQVLPALSMQVRMLHMATDVSFNDSSRYSGRPQIEHFVYQVPSEMDSDRLKLAVEAVIRQYDCFRTVFVPTRHPLSPFAQCVLTQNSPAAVLRRLDVVVDDDFVQEPRSSQIWTDAIDSVQICAEAALTFSRPGVFVSYVRSKDKNYCCMVLSMFQAIFDGFSLLHIREAIATQYVGKTALTDLLPVRSAVESLLSFDWTENMLYWMRRLSGVPPFRLQPGGRQAVPCPTRNLSGKHAEAHDSQSKTHMQSWSYESRLSFADLASCAAITSTSIMAVAETAWAKVLAQVVRSGNDSGEDGLNVQFGSVLLGRHDHTSLNCLAPMIATIPMQLIMDEARAEKCSHREVCQALATQHADASPHIHIPCPTLDQVKRTMNRFDTLLVVQAQGFEENKGRLDLPGFDRRANLLSPYKELDIGFPLYVELWPSLEGWETNLTLKFVFNTRRPGYEFLTKEWIMDIATAMDEAMMQVTEHSDQKFLSRRLDKDL